MKLPRDLSGEDLVELLSRLEYVVDRQTGSHIRLTTQVNGEHHVTIAAHDPLKIGTLDISRNEIRAQCLAPLQRLSGNA
jgi:predicted RNA binding protein YcfA (HicA-like mRNA interferase family)